jgi:hypothetical protein
MPFKVPGVWAEDNPPGLAASIPPMVIEKAWSHPSKNETISNPNEVMRRNISSPPETLNYEMLRPCQSAWNTPLLPVQKPGTNDYCPVPDLRTVDQAAVTLHPVVPNPYTLLALIPVEATCFSCLDLKDAFCIQLALVRQPIFAF